MDELWFDLPPASGVPSPDQARQPLSGTYTGSSGARKLKLRVDLQETGADGPFRRLNLISGDFFQHVAGGEWDYHSSFLVEHPSLHWEEGQAVIQGTMAYYRSGNPNAASDPLLVRPRLKAVIPLAGLHEAPCRATVEICRWGTYRETYLCDKTSSFLRTIDLEIDRIIGTELPRTCHTHSALPRPPDLDGLELDIPRAYQRAGIDMRVISDSQVLAPTEAGDDLLWDEDELHNAMVHHFSEWRDEPQWKLYLLIASHYKLYPQRIVTGLMYDHQYRDPNDPYPRQGAAAFYGSMAAVWGGQPQADFDRNYLRTCVHELGHALNLLHSFDKDRPESASWMNYPWRYPHGYSLPPGWDGTQDFWRDFHYEFDQEELRHLRHHPLLEVIPGGAAFGLQGYDAATRTRYAAHTRYAAPLAISPQAQAIAPVALYVRTRPERYLFDFAEPVTVELKLKNQTATPLVVPDMLNPEYGLVELFICDPRCRVTPYHPLFRLCGEPEMVELPPGGKLFESVFLAYGAEGFYFQEPGEYQIWAVYAAGGSRLRSNVLRLRVAFPQAREEETIALWTFGRDQGHVLYMRGAEHLPSGTDSLLEVADRFPSTHLARYIHFCLGSSQAREFKDVARGEVRAPRPERAARHLSEAAKFLRKTQRSALDNITHGRLVRLLADLYVRLDRPQAAKELLEKTVRYFTRLEVKPEVIEELRSEAASIETRT
jgi:hypothetical protein